MPPITENVDTSNAEPSILTATSRLAANGNFSIEIEENPGLDYFYPGQLIKGNVVYRIETDDRIEGIEVYFIGRSSVAWYTSDEGQGSSLASMLHRNSETYFSYKTEFINSQDADGPPSHFVSGIQNFPFEFQIPFGIPSSFQDTHTNGLIEYWFEAKLMRTGKMDLEVRLLIPVWKLLNLENYPGNLKSVTIGRERTLCCWCCKSGHVGFKVTLLKTKFALEEPIEYFAELFNDSSREIQRVEASITQSTILRATDGCTTICATTVLSGPELLLPVPALRAKAIQNMRGTINLLQNDLTPLNTTGCSFISVVHKLKLKMVIPRSKDLTGSVDIVIGRYPHQNIPGVPIAIAQVSKTATSSQIYSGIDLDVYSSEIPAED